MTKLSVNVNKIATLRNARGQDLPNIVTVSKDIIGFGAHGITIHPRPDERHIKKQDAYDLKVLIEETRSAGNDIEFNIEGYPSEDFLRLIEDTKPDQCTLVPDPPDVITSNAGWNLKQQQGLLAEVLSHLKTLNVRSSVFLDPEDNSSEQETALQNLRPDRIELYTEAFAKNFGKSCLQKSLLGYQTLANQALDAGVELNAGHDLNLENLHTLIEAIPEIKEVSIGHALICESLYLGLEATVKCYLEILSKTSRPCGDRL